MYFYPCTLQVLLMDFKSTFYNLSRSELACQQNRNKIDLPFLPRRSLIVVVATKSIKFLLYLKTKFALKSNFPLVRRHYAHKLLLEDVPDSSLISYWKKRFALEQIFLKGIKNNIEMGKGWKKAKKKLFIIKTLERKRRKIICSENKTNETKQKAAEAPEFKSTHKTFSARFLFPSEKRYQLIRMIFLRRRRLVTKGNDKRKRKLEG